MRHAGRTFNDASVMDFGCGYGRFIRAMYYYTNPDRIAGIDAWPTSLATSRDAGVLGRLLLSDAVLERLPVDDHSFDLAFAFSVFSHLSERAANACLAAVRRAIKPDGLFILTIRPVEFWEYNDGIRKSAVAPKMVRQHIAGYAFEAQRADYGNASMPISFFSRHGWQALRYDTIPESYQVAVILKPV